MGITISSVEIEISNKTRNFTLKNPRTYFYSGHVLNHPPQEVSPGSTVTCKFTNNTLFWGCNGLLAYEAESFTLAIYFSNPIDYNRFSPEMGLELSLDRVHRQDLRGAYNRLLKISGNPSDKTCLFPHVIFNESQGQAQLSAGPVKVTATMSRERRAVIKVVVEDRGGSGQEAKIETPSPGKHVQEKREPVGPPGVPSRRPWNYTDSMRALQRPPEPHRHL